MNIGIDIDDTVSNTQEFKLAYGVQYSINELNKLNIVNPKEAYAIDIFGWDSETEKRFFDDYFTEKMIDIQPKVLSKEIINRLKDEGHNIYFITARNDNIILNSLQVSKKWLDKNGFKYNDVFVNTGNKNEICKNLNLDLFIDDSINLCKKVSNEGIKALLFTSITNENIEIDNKDIKRVYNWPEIYYHIQNMI